MDSKIGDLPQSVRNPVISKAAVKPPWSLARIIVAVGLVGGLLLLLAVSCNVTVSGRVISAGANVPIEGAMVYAHSGAPYEEDGLNSYARTDATGRFTVSARGQLSVEAWKPGYALHGVVAGFAPTLLRREIVIELRELTQTNWVQEHDEFQSLAPRDGFSFKLGKVVKGNNPDADIILTQDIQDPTSAILNACGEGGLIFQAWDDNVDFYNSPEAPLAGYEQRLPLVLGTSGPLFRAHGGRIALLKVKADYRACRATERRVLSGFQIHEGDMGLPVGWDQEP